MKLYKVLLGNGFSQVVKLLSAFIISKVMAIVLGPSGFALIGQFQNFVAIVTGLSTGGINNGVVKLIAENNNELDTRKNIIITAFNLTFYFTILCSIVVFFGASYFSEYIFKTTEYKNILKVLGLTLFFFSSNSLIISILNGLKEIKKIIIINISTSIIGMLLSIILVYQFHLSGALIGIVISQTLVSVFSFFWISKLKVVEIRKTLLFFDKKTVLQLIKFSTMAFTALIIGNYTQLLIRSMIINKLSIVDAGIWQATAKLSDLSIGFIGATFSVYYLPVLAELKDYVTIKKSMIKFFKIVIPLVVLITLFIYSFKYYIILLLFSKKFLAMSSLMFLQLLGVNLKIISYIFSFFMLAKCYYKTFIISELVFAIFYYFLNVFFVDYYGLYGTSVAYFLNYVFYASFSFIFFLLIRKKLKTGV